MDTPPAIASQIEMKIIDLETFTITDQSLMGHLGFTPSEKAFYLYLDVSEFFVGSGSEDMKGCVWDRHYKCILAKLPHTSCVYCVAFRPSDTRYMLQPLYKLSLCINQFINWLKYLLVYKLVYK